MVFLKSAFLGRALGKIDNATIVIFTLVRFDTFAHVTLAPDLINRNAVI